MPPFPWRLRSFDAAINTLLASLKSVVNNVLPRAQIR
jgi:hypothetical protein